MGRTSRPSPPGQGTVRKCGQGGGGLRFPVSPPACTKSLCGQALRLRAATPPHRESRSRPDKGLPGDDREPPWFPWEGQEALQVLPGSADQQILDVFVPQAA